MPLAIPENHCRAEQQLSVASFGKQKQKLSFRSKNPLSTNNCTVFMTFAFAFFSGGRRKRRKVRRSTGKSCFFVHENKGEFDQVLIEGGEQTRQTYWKVTGYL